MHVGSLNKRIELQSSTAVSDGMGGQTLTWATQDTVWAAIWPTSAADRIEGGQTVMTITHRIRIRYHRTLTGAWRVAYGTRYFAIVSIVHPNEGGRMLDLLCKEAEA